MMNDKDKKPGNPWTKSLLIWVGVLFALVLFVQMIDGGSRTATGTQITYSDFLRQVNDGNVSSATIATDTSRNLEIAGKLTSGEAFRTVAPGDAKVSDTLIAKGVAVREPPSIICTKRTSANSTPAQISRLLVQGLPGFFSLSFISTRLSAQETRFHLK